MARSSGPTRLSLPEIPDLGEALSEIVRQVPSGAVTTFGDLARALGDRHAAIWISRWAADRPPSDDCPIHRLVRKNGELGRPVHPETIDRLTREGVQLTADFRSVSPATPRRCDFRTASPLIPLRDWLQRAAAHVREPNTTKSPRWIAGVDVAYPASDRARAAAVLVDATHRMVAHEVSIECPVAFPYISGFLTFRELPPMLAAYEALVASSREPDVVMVDGQGRLHPQRGGVATGFAAVTGRPTIGVAKSLLCGKIDRQSASQGVHSARPVLDGNDLLGYALHTDGPRATIYISVGGWLSLPDALGITQGLMGTTRLPLPTHAADRLTRKRQP